MDANHEKVKFAKNSQEQLIFVSQSHQRNSVYCSLKLSDIKKILIVPDIFLKLSLRTTGRTSNISLKFKNVSMNIDSLVDKMQGG